jgi:adenylate cyclase
LVKEKNKRLKLSHDVEILSTLLNVSSAINSYENLHTILTMVVREMVSCFKADNCSIMLYDKVKNKLKTFASYGRFADKAKNAEMPWGEGVAGSVLKSGDPVLIQGAVKPDLFPGTPDKGGRIHSAMCVPLKSGTQNVGVINLNICNAQAAFSDSHLLLLSVLANNAAMSIRNAMLNQEKAKRKRIEGAFEKLHSPSVLDYLTKRINTCKEPRELRTKTEICVLFGDLRGFSALMANLDIGTCADFLDEFYGIMNEVVVRQDGYVDKFIGDEVMAIFHSTESVQAASISSIRAARRMITAFDTLKRKFVQKFPIFASLGLGIGLNAGQVFIGGIGSSKRMDYTVLGTPINLARRLCSYADSDQIMVTRQLSESIGRKINFKPVEYVYLVGFCDPVEVCQVEMSQQGVTHEAA